jgi:hypothetical protein
LDKGQIIIDADGLCRVMFDLVKAHGHEVVASFADNLSYKKRSLGAIRMDPRKVACGHFITKGG